MTQVWRKLIAQLCKTRNNVDELYPPYGLAANTHSSIMGIKLLCEGLFFFFFNVPYPCYASCSISKQNFFAAIPYQLANVPNCKSQTRPGVIIGFMACKVDVQGDVGSTVPECLLENSLKASGNFGQTDAKDDMFPIWKMTRKKKKSSQPWPPTDPTMHPYKTF